MCGLREPALDHVLSVAAYRIANDPGKIGVPLCKPRGEAIKESKQIVQHQDLTVAVRPGADPDGGYRQSAGDDLSERTGNRLKYNGEGPCLLKRQGVLKDAARGVEPFPLHLQSFPQDSRLRGQPDMTHHRNPRRSEEHTSELQSPLNL